MAFEICTDCRTLVICGAHHVETRAYCPSCVRKLVLRKQAAELAQNVKGSSDAYQAALERLKVSPSDPRIREQALELGRRYASWTRHAAGQGGVTLFDEVALANDIQAACAAASRVGEVTQATTAEDRLQKLEVLRKKKLISESEYAANRQRILSEL